MICNTCKLNIEHCDCKPYSAHAWEPEDYGTPLAEPRVQRVSVSLIERYDMVSTPVILADTNHIARRPPTCVDCHGTGRVRVHVPFTEDFELSSCWCVSANGSLSSLVRS